LLHIADVLLLWLVLRRLGVGWAWLGAAIFAVHPVQVESVAWITERKNVLSTFFYLLALLAYMKSQPVAGDEKGGVAGWWVLSTLFFAMALASKTVTCSLPAAILVLIWWKRGTLNLRDILPLIPFFVLGIAGAMFTSWVEAHHVDARGIDFALSPIQRCLIASRAIFFYAGKLVAPFNLIFMYPRWRVNSSAWWQYVYIVAGVGIAAALWSLRKKLGRGPLAACMLFVGTLVPALGFFDVAPMRFSFVADHFQYLASAALIALFAAAMRHIFSGTGEYPEIVCAPLLIVLFVLTWNRQAAYVDAQTLWNDTIAKNPSSWMAYDNLGHIFVLHGDVDDAIQQYQHALDIAPQEAETHLAMAAGLYAKGKIDEAMDMYSQTLSIDPSYAAAHYARGLIFENRGQLADAEKEYRAVIAIRDDYAPAHFKLGVFARAAGRLDEAKSEFEKAILNDPLFADAYYSLGNIELNQHHYPEAAAQYRLALRADPDDGAAHYNLGVALKQMNDATGASQEFRAAGVATNSN
jgi:protein O-mannosyl-transferase